MGDKLFAALFVFENGVYGSISFADAWHEGRDARLYRGDLPVVAHPPCSLWGRFAAVNFARYGGAHNFPGNDDGMFESALCSVRRWGGVLEHPAESMAFGYFDLGSPEPGKWKRSADGDGWITEIRQAAYGHVADKRTWLYCSAGPAPPPLDWRPAKGTHQVGFKGSGGKSNGKRPSCGKKVAKETPHGFACALGMIAIERGAYSEKRGER